MERLPTEILIEVLAHVPYWDLIFRVPLVNRTFYRIIHSATQARPLDIALFRDHVITRQIPNDNGGDGKAEDTHLEANSAGSSVNKPATPSHTVHPIFGSGFEGFPDRDPRNRLRYRVPLPQSLVDFSCLQVPIFNENAVSPAVSLLSFTLGNFDPIHVEGSNTASGGAVTVVDIFRAISSNEEDARLATARPVLLQPRIDGEIGDWRLGVVVICARRQIWSLFEPVVVELERGYVKLKTEGKFLFPKEGYGEIY